MDRNLDFCHRLLVVARYQNRGYLASGMVLASILGLVWFNIPALHMWNDKVNYLAQLGWNDGTKQAGLLALVLWTGSTKLMLCRSILKDLCQEIYTIDELLEAFKMERMSKAWLDWDEILSLLTDTNNRTSTSGILTSFKYCSADRSGMVRLFHSCFLFLLLPFASFCQVAAIFDTDKFKWVNGHHVRRLNDEEVLCLFHFVMFRPYSV